MAYCNAAQVRQLAGAITTDVISDADIATLADQWANPMIDGALAGMGAPFTTIPSVIADIAALFTAARIFTDKFYQTGDYSQWAEKAREEAWDLLNRIKSGEIVPGGEVSTASVLVAADPSDDRSEYEIFTDEGDKELDWERREEERE